MKKYMAIVLGLLFCAASCSAEQPEVEAPGSYVEYSSYVELNTMDEIAEYSTNIVKATLTSMEVFDGGTYVYLFDVTEDFTENTPQQIHVYHRFDAQYTVGTSYYLFLQGTDLALYPHTVYSTPEHNLGFLDAEGVQTLSGEGTRRGSQAEDVISQAAQKGTVGSAVEGMLPKISFTEDISQVADEADVIARVRLSQRENINQYVSNYEVQLLEIVKGPEGSVAAYITLPPDLDQGKEYYIFLAEDPEIKGEYYTYSQAYPVLEVSAEATAEIAAE
ncbi:MAG: hypothetical protein HFE99_09750 [Ruminiclostridium sp.]|nr:hypothetical protein [Ruminiclostridium sp.]